MPGLVFSRENYAPLEPHMERHPLVPPFGGVINEALDIITYGSPDQREAPAKGLRPKALMSVQNVNIQSQALLNVKDSNKDERQRIVYCRFKFEELQLEQIKDLEVAIYL
ncbi:protein MOR1 [Lactuca sativa]|uniref:protein MOR1 n=1 Tax=Lactuca sativa TaxID=4236 RepID=UPI001C68B0FA|nr:protein MOR1 [Lactuca sativa]